MVPWFGGSNTFPTTLKINLPAMLFKHSPCSLHHHSLLLVRPVTRFGVPTLLNKLSFFPPFRLSFRGTTDLPPFPFSGTHHVMRKNVFRRPNLTGQLYFVCEMGHVNKWAVHTCMAYIRECPRACMFLQRNNFFPSAHESITVTVRSHRQMT